LNCESCVTAQAPDAAELAWLAAEYGQTVEAAAFRHGQGCSRCNGTGLLGRTGIYEMLEISPDMVKALNQGQNNEFVALAERALQGRSLRHQALHLALSGRAPVSEVIRVASELGD